MRFENEGSSPQGGAPWADAPQAAASDDRASRDRRENRSCAPLHALLKASQSCELACRRAADRVSVALLGETLLRQAHERARFSREIDTELSALGVEPPSGRDSGDHVIEPWNRGTTDTEHVAQCIRAHEQLVEAYRQAHTAALPRDVENVLERQAKAVTCGLEFLRARIPPDTAE